MARVADVDAVPPRVLERIAERVSHLLRKPDHLDVVAVVEQTSAPLELRVEPTRDAHRPALNPTRERGVVARLADQVHVIALDRELADPEVALVATRDKRASEN